MDYLKSLTDSISSSKRRRGSQQNSLTSLMESLVQNAAAGPIQRPQSRLAERAAALSAPKVAPQAATPAVQAAAGRHSLGDGHGHGSAGEVKGLNAEFNASLQALFRDAPGKVSVGSGYRSIAEQTKIYNLWKAGKHPAPRVAKPGKSNHNHGLAADLKYANAATRAWVHANAANYGLRLPMGDEPWHIEPINARSKRR